ncbi:MAG: arginine--tRNA ligase [Proteobacteria bacterium]|nr:arginine--tRNA ligase [Pseudomonadota bacterium]
MNTFEQQLTNLFTHSFDALGFDKNMAKVVVSNRPELCQFQCNAAMPLAKIAKKNPLEIAQDIISKLPDNEIIKNIEAVAPGFININLTEEFIAKHISSLIDDKRQGFDKKDKPLKTIVDYCGANIAKSMHVGHLRATIIGESVKRIFKFVGDEVLGDIHMGDWGTQMGMMIMAVKEMDSTLPYFDENFTGEYPKESPVTIEDLERLYPDMSGRCKVDENLAASARLATLELQQGRKGYYALWEHFVSVSLKALKADLTDLNIDFDLWLGESDVNHLIEPTVDYLKQSGITRISEGALIVNVTPKNGKELAPLLLLKSDGAALYATTDLATVKDRVENHKAEQIVYVVDGRQSLHFYQFFDVAQRSGIAKNVEMSHAGFGTVNGKDGKPFKTRSGGVLKLRDLIDIGKDAALKKMVEVGSADKFSEVQLQEVSQKVGVSAVKFADLQNHRSAGYIFDIEKFVQFEGKTGPYLLYTDVRIRSMLEKASEMGIAEGELLAPTIASEINLMLTLDKFKYAITKAYEDKAPNYICEHAYNLAQSYSRFYNDCHILTQVDKAKQSSWITLSKLVSLQLNLMFELLGLQVPERM